MSDPKFTVLFGAGASKDAGLPDAFELTEAVYNDLSSKRSKQSRLFAIIVSKLVLRNAREGGSPFARVNIEDVYDALKRLVNRDTDPLAEFVSGWDSSLANITGSVHAKRAIEAILSPVTLTHDRRADRGPSIDIDNWRLQQAADELEVALRGDEKQLQGASLQPFLDTLIGLLDVETARTDYMEQFLSRIGQKAECLATLNYDRLVEESLSKIGLKYDLGLSRWNEARFVQFHGRAVKLLKLHGSVDWKVKGDDEIVFDSLELSRFGQSGMIFGGQADKLVPHGPFLHLRHEFYKLLRRSSYLIVIGYSYADVHLNALIRSWISTRRNGKLINVDPGGFKASEDIYRGMYDYDGNGIIKGKHIEIKTLEVGFADSLDEIAAELSRPPVPE